VNPKLQQLQARAEACTGDTGHGAIWLLEPSAAGKSLFGPMPLVLDLVPALERLLTPSDSEVASITFCPPPLLGALSPGKLVTLTLQVSRGFELDKFPIFPRWTAINTPYGAEGLPNPLGTVQTQAIDVAPVDGSLVARRRTKTRRVEHRTYMDVFYSYFARLSGELSVGFLAEPFAHVDILVGGRTVESTDTHRKSDYLAAFSTTLRLRKTTTYQAVYRSTPAVLPESECLPALPLGGGAMRCGTIMGNGFTITTEQETVRRPKLTHKRINRVKH